MAFRISKFADRITGFVKSRVGLSMLFALQIFVIKTTRTKPAFIASVAFIAAGAIVGLHLGICPVKHTLSCLCAK